MFGRKRIEELEMQLDNKIKEIIKLKKLLIADGDLKKIRCSNIYGPGKYVEGIDIASGIYDLHIESGEGSVFNSKERIYFGKDGYESLEYYGFRVETGIVFEITGNAYISFIYRDSIIAFEDKLKNIQEEEAKEKDAHWEKVLDSQESAIVCKGTYKGGVDIPVGVYDVRYIDGEGYLEFSRGYIYEKMSKEDTKLYRNLKVTKGSKMTISGTLIVEILVSKPVLPKKCNETTNILGPGRYRGGVDIPVGQYLMKTNSGRGYISYGPDMDIDILMDKNEKDGAKQMHISLGKSDKFDVTGNLEVEIYNAPTIIPSSEDVLPKNVIVTGEYIVGVDIEEGKYYLKRLRGYGSIEVIDNTDNDNYEYMSFKQDSQNENDRIKYIRLYNSDKIMIDGTLEIEVFRK